MTSSAEGGLALAVSGQGRRAAAAVSGQGRRAVAAVFGQGGRAPAAVSGQGGRAAAAVSGEGGRAAVAVSGDGEAAVSRKRKQCDYENILDYPCTERLRWRRLLAYLRENCYDQIYHVAKDKLVVILDVEDLVKRIKAGHFLKAGQLEEACDLVSTFAPIRQFNSYAELLTLFLQYLMAIHRFADGNTAKEGIVHDWFVKLSRNSVVGSKFPYLATLVADVLSLRTVRVRNSLDWQRVRNRAAEIVEDIVYEVPELKEMTRYPRGQNELYDVMPIRCSFRPRRQVKKTCKKQATDLAKFYLEMKKRLVPSAQMDYDDYSAVSSNKLAVLLIQLFEKVLQAGQRMLLKQGHPPEYLSRGVYTPNAAHACKSIPGHMMIEKVHQPEHASKQAVHAYKSTSERMEIEQEHGSEHASNQAVKCPRFLESHRDSVYQGTALKITENFVKI